MLNHHVILPRLRKVRIAVVYSWPGGAIRCAGADGGRNPHRVLEVGACCLRAVQKQWVQMCWNGDRRDYDVAVAEGIATKPIWPDDLDLRNLLKLGFADKIISNPDHPYVKQLRGLAE